jgi:hypothetical protein
MGSSKSCTFDSNTLVLSGCLCKSDFINCTTDRKEYYLFKLDKDYNMVVHLWNIKLPMEIVVKCEISGESVKLTDNHNSTMGINYESTIIINRTNSLVRPAIDEHDYEHIDILTELLTNNLTNTQKDNIVKYMRVIEIVSGNFKK